MNKNGDKKETFVPAIAMDVLFGGILLSAVVWGAILLFDIRSGIESGGSDSGRDPVSIKTPGYQKEFDRLDRKTRRLGERIQNLQSVALKSSRDESGELERETWKHLTRKAIQKAHNQFRKKRRIRGYARMGFNRSDLRAIGVPKEKWTRVNDTLKTGLVKMTDLLTDILRRERKAFSRGDRSRLQKELNKVYGRVLSRLRKQLSGDVYDTYLTWTQTVYLFRSTKVHDFQDQTGYRPYVRAKRVVLRKPE